MQNALLQVVQNKVYKYLKYQVTDGDTHFNFINTFIQKWTPEKKFGACKFADRADLRRKKLKKNQVNVSEIECIFCQF